jgi:nitrous oxide reductase accessory protein NosL
MKTIHLLAAVVAFVAVLAACSKEAPTPAPTPKPKTEVR